MSAPGKSTVLTDAEIPRSPGSDDGASFIAAVFDEGPVDKPYPVVSMDELTAKFGGRSVASAAGYDWAEAFFAAGGPLLYVTRRVGPAAARAVLPLFDQSGSSSPSDVALYLHAAYPGAYGNKLNGVVTATGGTFTIEVTHDDTGRIALSPSLADRAAALAWAEDYASEFTLELGASAEDPRAAVSASLTSGADDTGSLTDSMLTDTLDLATPDYGFGRVVVPNATTDAAHAAILDHCAEHFRASRLDFVDTAVVADLVADCADLRSRESAHTGAPFGPWAVCKGVTPGTTRTIPWSAIQCGMEGRNIAAGLPIGQGAAGRHGVAPDFVLGLSQEPWTEDEREALNDAGFNVVRVVKREIRTYGNRTLVDPALRPAWVELSGATAALLIANEFDDAMEDSMFDLLDFRGFNVNALGNRLRGIALKRFADDTLYGELAEDAFFIDVGPTVNTPATLANRELKAKAELRTTPSAERIELTISKQRI